MSISKMKDETNMVSGQITENMENKPKFKRQLVWRNIILMFILHLSGLYGAILGLSCKWSTIFFGYILVILTSFGIQCGAHRLWCHRTYKAKPILQIILMILDTLGLQNDIYEWSRDHRVHHKYSDTDADPHNSHRGFFFSHMGWLCCKKHPDVVEKGKTLDMSDLDKDSIVRFQRAFYIPLVIVIWGIIPTYVPYYFWKETLWNSWFVCVMARYCVTLNATWCVNSFAHFYGMQPYDKGIRPVEAHMRHYLLGEGFHNYHHVFPWDYSASEFGPFDVFNPATAFIDLMAKIGWAYDLKKASKDVIKSRQKKFGDIDFQNRSKLMEFLTGFLVLSAPFWGYFFARMNPWLIPILILAGWFIQ